MKKSLSNSLSQFISNHDQFENPFEDDTEKDAAQSKIEAVIDKEEESKDESSDKKSKKKKKDKFEDVIEKGNSFINSYMQDDVIDDFEGYLDNYLMDDEDIDLKNNLIRQGRKYARDTKTTGETSEISKAYSATEKMLNDLLKEIDSDKEAVQKDITNMRMMRTRNYKTMADLIESKSQLHNTALSTIKEMNAMKKNQFELQMKVDKSKKEEEQDDSTANKAIQQLFGMGRDAILGSGYSDISGADTAGSYEEDYSSVYDEDAEIHKKIFGDEDAEESDGDKFLKYEGRGVHYILLYNDEGHREIIAEDKEGNIVPDYPMPTDPNNLDFNISESTNTATDNLSNQYEVRKI